MNSRICTHFLWLAAMFAAVAGHGAAVGQQPSDGEALAPATAPEVGISQQELQQLAAEAAQQRPAEVAAAQPMRGQIDFLSLLMQGGAMMIPIALMSLLVVAVALERLFALRGGALLPRGLRREMARAAELSPMQAPAVLSAAADKYRSVGGRMLADMMQKVGRPLPEIEATIAESAQHEADAMYNNVRWLNLAAGVTPLIGLLGTVWGMIIAFYNTTQLGAGTNKAEFLAEGIYVALVTTLGGLAVAIPAAICAHYFEGRITHTVAAIERELRRLIPKFEPLEGKFRWVPEQQRLLTTGPSTAGADPEVAAGRSRAAVG